jgi:putative transposase
MGRNLTGEDTQVCLTDLFCKRGVPVHLRSDNDSVFASEKVRNWLYELGSKTLFIELGSPWEKYYIESLTAKFLDEVWNRDILHTLQEAQVIKEQWRKEYKTVRPQGALGYRPPAPGAILVPQLALPLMGQMS